MPKKEWNYNCHTGTYSRHIHANGRILTDGSNWDGMLYRAEFWGNYGRHFPVYGAWRRSLDAARRELRRLTNTEKTMRAALAEHYYESAEDLAVDTAHECRLANRRNDWTIPVWVMDMAEELLPDTY